MMSDTWCRLSLKREAPMYQASEMLNNTCAGECALS
jgi:hypothetical protein